MKSLSLRSRELAFRGLSRKSREPSLCALRFGRTERKALASQEDMTKAQSVSGYMTRNGEKARVGLLRTTTSEEHDKGKDRYSGPAEDLPTFDRHGAPGLPSPLEERFSSSHYETAF